MTTGRFVLRQRVLDELVRANTRSGADQGERAVHRLILDVATDPQRILSLEELGEIVQHVARAGFDPHALERARGNIVGSLRPDGDEVQRGERLPPAEVHYLRHVVVQPEWPAGTSLAGYVASIREVIGDSDSGLLVCQYQGAWQLTVVRESRLLRGPAGQDWLLVDYRLGTGHWTTAHQLRQGLADLRSPRREHLRWLRIPPST